MELTPEEIRVLGCLVEKEATTPDNYPLSSNALVSACNQTTNRDPVVSYTEREVDQLMMDCYRWPSGPFGMVKGAGSGWS